MTGPRPLTSPSRLASSARNLALALLLAVCGPAAAQETEDGRATVTVPPPILTLDQDRLFTGSAFGTRVNADIEERSTTLAAENRKIESELTAEELALTEARPTLTPEEFRTRADAFDTKVQKIRAEQDAKTRDLGSFRDAEQQRFFAEIGAILADIAKARGALAVVDRRVLLVSADSIDITDEVIRLVDERLGDGTTP